MKYFPESHFTKWIDITWFSSKELLNFYDDPCNFKVWNAEKNIYDSIFPKNIIISLTHWSYDLPLESKKQIIWYWDGREYKKTERLLKNFSDFWTTDIVNAMNIPESQIVRTYYSRAIWDCNRDICDLSPAWFIRDTDFNDKRLFTEKVIQSLIWKKHYKDYHNEINKKLMKIEQSWQSSFLFDIHDTWVRLMDFDVENDQIKDELFPFINISDCSGSSCVSWYLELFWQELHKAFWFSPVLREPFKSWFVTQKHWMQVRKSWNGQRNVIQIELGRFLYMKESTQEIDLERAWLLARWLKKAIIEAVKKC